MFEGFPRKHLGRRGRLFRVGRGQPVMTEQQDMLDMTNTGKRREFLQYGSAVGAGLALGAFTRTSLASQPKTMADSDFLGRFDTPMSDQEIRKLVVGNTMDGVTFKGQEYLAYLDPDGTVDKMIGERREVGRWDIENGGIGFQFPTLAGGNHFFLKVYHHKNGVLYKGWSPDEQRWVWFVTDPGKAAELA